MVNNAFFLKGTAEKKSTLELENIITYHKFWPAELTSAPLFTNSVTHSKSPDLAARCKTVEPSKSRCVSGTPDRIKRSVISRFFCTRRVKEEFEMVLGSILYTV